MIETHSIESGKKSFLQKHTLKLTIFAVFLAMFVFGWFLSDAFVIHGRDLPDDYWSSTSVLKTKLLDKAGFMSVLTIMTVTSIVLVAVGYWKLHSLPKKHSEHTGQSRLVFWLCMLGFYYNWLWIAAILIVVTDWDIIAEVIRGIRKEKNNPKEIENNSVIEGEKQ